MDNEIPTFPSVIKETILPRKTYNWIDDTNVYQCYDCKVKFTWFTRKHHCRGCGRIFCSLCLLNNVYCTNNCISKSGLINSDCFLEELIKPNIYEENLSYYSFPLKVIDYFNTVKVEKYLIKYPQKTCNNCYNNYENIKNVSSIVCVLELLPIEIIHIYKLKMLNKLWYETCNIYLSKFREIQYNLPYCKKTKFETDVLYNNFNNIVYHNKLLCRFIKCFNWYANKNLSKSLIDKLYDSLKTKNTIKYSCKMFMCDHSCSECLTNEDILDILMSVKYHRIRKFVVHLLNESNDIAMYISLLVKCLKYDEEELIVSNYLINESIYDIDFQNKLFCELLIYTKLPCLENQIFKDTYDKLLNVIYSYTDGTQINNLLVLIDNIDSLNLFKTKNINNESLIKLMNYFPDFNKSMNRYLSKNSTTCTMIPINIKYIIYDEIKYFSSKTQPMLIPYIDQMNIKKYMLYKKEDVRKDYIIMSLIKYIDKILKKHGYDMDIVVYDVLPISTDSGLIEIVPNSNTIYTIKSKLNTTILNHILNKNPNETVDVVRKKFIKSTSAYCIISYLLGLGDRHLDNIMITDDGKLFHIDYSFILGEDCKPLAPKIRLTNDMIECIGGINSEYYKEFESYCCIIYNILRNYVNIFTLFFSLLTEKNNVENEIRKRFLPAEFAEEANIQLIKTIEISQSSYTYIDFFHHQYKDTITSIIDYLV